MANSHLDSSSKPGVGKQGGGNLPVTTAKKASSLTPPATAKKPVSAGKRSKSTARKSKTAVTPEQRQEMIAVAAYYRAERRGFQCQCCDRDWSDAAAEVDRMLEPIS